MIRRLPNLTALLMALVLALTSGAMAQARGQMRDAAGNVVLCTGTGPVVVSVDADGQPIGPSHICPDCALALFDAATDTPVSAQPFTVWTDFRFDPIVETPAPGAPVAGVRARGPPLG